MSVRAFISLLLIIVNAKRKKELHALFGGLSRKVGGRTCCCSVMFRHRSSRVMDLTIPAYCVNDYVCMYITGGYTLIWIQVDMGSSVLMLGHVDLKWGRGLALNVRVCVQNQNSFGSQFVHFHARGRLSSS